jgi:hypothetical protein
MEDIKNSHIIDESNSPLSCLYCFSNVLYVSGKFRYCNKLIPYYCRSNNCDFWGGFD